MAIAAAGRLPLECWRLLLYQGHGGAIDLRIISGFVTDWFSGQPVTSTYPPASHVLLWPAMGWLPFPILRWAWAISMGVMLVWLTRQIERAAGVEAGLERAWLRLFIVSNYATVVVIGNGQLAIHLLPALLAGIVMLSGRAVPWRTAVTAAALMLVAMIKPSLAIPFFWVPLFACGAAGVVVGTAVSYLGISLAAMSVRPDTMGAIVHAWLARISRLDLGYANIHEWSGALGVAEYGPLLSLLLVGVLGGWVYTRRRADLWVLLGVSAIIARVWTYHQLYDDLLLFVPVAAIWRVGRTPLAAERGLDRVGRVLILLGWAGLMGPGTLLLADHPLGLLYRVVQTLIWTAMLGFLVHWANLEPVAGTDEGRPALAGVDS